MLIMFESGTALYRQVYSAFRSAILEGRLAANEPLPATRTLARELGVSRNVVITAYEQLVAEGYAETRPGAGTFVRSLPGLPPTERPEGPLPELSSYAERALAAQPGHFYDEAPLTDFRYGLPPADPPLRRAWRRALAACALSVPLGYGDTLGYLPLREVLATYVQRSRGVRCSAEHILVTSGSQQALDLVSRVLLEPGDTVLTEDPQYRGARQVFAAAGARLLAATVDTEGLKLPFPAPKAKLAYVTPSHQFPSGAVMSLSRRLSLLAWAREQSAFILEDDYDSEYRYEGRPVPAIQSLDESGRVLYVGTFSKVLFPALRLGFLVLPPRLVEVFEAAKWLTDRHSGLTEQAALAQFITRGHFGRHLRRMRRQNGARRAALLQALDDCLGSRAHVQGVNAGVHVLVWLEGVSAEGLGPLLSAARRAGLGLYPVTPYYLHPPTAAGILFGYASLAEEEIRAGVRRFAEVLAEVESEAS